MSEPVSSVESEIQESIRVSGKILKRIGELQATISSPENSIQERDQAFQTLRKVERILDATADNQPNTSINDQLTDIQEQLAALQTDNALIFQYVSQNTANASTDASSSPPQKKSGNSLGNR